MGIGLVLREYQFLAYTPPIQDRLSSALLSKGIPWRLVTAAFTSWLRAFCEAEEIKEHSCSPGYAVAGAKGLSKPRMRIVSNKFPGLGWAGRG